MDFVYIKLIFFYLYWFVDELLIIENTLFNSFVTVYNCCLEVYIGIYKDNFYSKVLPLAEEEGFEEKPKVKYK